jgi:hypothetical protein
MEDYASLQPAMRKTMTLKLAKEIALASITEVCIYLFGLSISNFYFYHFSINTILFPLISLFLFPFLILFFFLF